MGFVPEDDSGDWEAPIPLVDENLPEFPLESLRIAPWLQAFVSALSVANQVPIDFPGMMVFIVLATAAQGRIVVQAPNRIEALAMYLSLFAESGTRKTGTMSALAAPLRSYEEATNQGIDLQIADQTSHLEILQGRKKAAQRRAIKAQDPVIRQEAADEAASITRLIESYPLKRRLALCVQNTTAAAMEMALAEQGGRLTFWSDEADFWEIVAGKLSNGGMEVFLRGYDGESLTVKRLARSVDIPSACLSLGLSPQPSVLKVLGKGSEVRDRGLTARFLLFLPKGLLGYRDQAPPPIPEAISTEYHRCVRKLLEVSASAGDDGLSPIRLRFNRAAEKRVIAYAEEIETEMRPAKRLGAVTDWASKLNGKVCRMAALLHLAAHVDDEQPWKKPISVSAVERSIEIANYAIPHNLSVFGQIGLDPVVQDALFLLPHIAALCEEQESRLLRVREIHAKVKHRFRTRPSLDPVLRLLIDHHYLRRMVREGRRDGRPSEYVEVNPHYAESPIR